MRPIAALLCILLVMAVAGCSGVGDPNARPIIPPGFGGNNSDNGGA
jgi:hypothetical protein